MASQMFSASQVCQIVSGEDGDLDYVFPGSDDGLGMEETDEEDLENEVDSSEMHSKLSWLPVDLLVEMKGVAVVGVGVAVVRVGVVVEGVAVVGVGVAVVGVGVVVEGVAVV